MNTAIGLTLYFLAIVLSVTGVMSQYKNITTNRNAGMFCVLVAPVLWIAGIVFIYFVRI